MIKIIGALDKRGSQLSNALRFNSISNFPASISSFEIMPISEILAFFSWKTEQISREIIGFQSKISPRESSIWTWIKVRWKFGKLFGLMLPILKSWSFQQTFFEFQSVSSGTNNILQKLTSRVENSRISLSGRNRLQVKIGLSKCIFCLITCLTQTLKVYSENSHISDTKNNGYNVFFSQTDYKK